MSTRAAQMLGHPPGLHFRPDDDEVVEFFLLPSIRGEPAWFPGVVVIEDDSAANTLPWKLLKRHGLGDDDEAYFFVRTNDAKEVARQERYCDGSATWASQRYVPGGSCIGGEEIKWRRNNLNLHIGRGKRSGSTGWVMHEYTVTEPPCPFLRICHVKFSGHGKERKRVSDGESDCQAGEPASKRARVDAAAANSGSSTCVYGSTAPAIDQGKQQQQPLTDQYFKNFFRMCPLANSNDLPMMNFPHMEFGKQHVMMPQPMAQETGEPRCYSGVISVPDDHDDCPAGEGMPCMESEGQILATDQEIQDAQLHPVQSSTRSFPFAASAGAELYLELREQVPTIEQHQPMVQETATAEHQYGGDQQDQQDLEFWRSIGVDIDNIFF